MSRIETVSHTLRSYGVRGTALRAADRLLKRTPEEVPYERWQQRARLSSRDYARMVREELYYRPVIGVVSRAEGRDRLAFVQSLNLQIYRNFRPMKDAPDAAYLLLAGAGCSLAPDLLWQCAKLLSESGSTGTDSYSDIDLIYFDSDRIGADGRKTDPVFRPEFDPDLLEHCNYMGEVVLVRASLAREVGLPGSGAGQMHAFLRRICAQESVPAGRERSGAVRHIPRVLYHVAQAAQQSESERACDTCSAAVPRPLISVLIPNRDHAEDLERCVTSLQQVSGWENLEILILENNSEEERTWELYRALCARDARVRVLSFDGAFNYSAVNNFGARQARGAYLLFLNNDTQVLDAAALPAMEALARRAEVGAVGALLFYPDGAIQHGGTILGYGGIAGHAFAGERPEDAVGTPQAVLLEAVHNVSAVTAACLMMRREVFEQAGGFDEGLAVTFNDVDLCLRLRKMGLRVLQCPQARLVHYESRSRGAEDSEEKVARFHREIRTFVRRWERELEEGDPFYSPNWTLTGTPYTCRDMLREKAAPYRRYLYL